MTSTQIMNKLAALRVAIEVENGTPLDDVRAAMLFDVCLALGLDPYDTLMVLGEQAAAVIGGTYTHVEMS